MQVLREAHSITRSISALQGGRKRRATPRTSSGCLTCRRRKKKCDGLYPICNHCIRLNLECLREAPSRPWTTHAGAAEGSCESGQTEEAGHSQSRTTQIIPNLHLFTSIVPRGIEKEDRRLVMRYYIQSFSSLLTTNLENNCFMSVFLPLATESPVFLDVLIAWAASHLALVSDRYADLALSSRCLALKSLSSSLISPDSGVEIQLASCLALCSMETILGNSSEWFTHLNGASQILQASLALGSHHKVHTDSLPDLMRTFEGRWLLRNFAYHDVMMSITMDRKPLVQGNYWSSCENEAVDSYFGYGSHIIYLVSETSCLAADMASYQRQSPNEDKISTENPQDVQDVQDVQDAQDVSTLSKRAFLIEKQLREWSCGDLEDVSLKRLADAYCSAALIHLYRTIRRYFPEVASSLASKIDRCVAQVVELLHDIPQNCHAECTLLFPLFLAGGEAQSSEHIFTIRERMQDIMHSRKFYNIRDALSVLDELWRLRGRADVALEARTVDWLDILSARNLRLALT